MVPQQVWEWASNKGPGSWNHAAARLPHETIVKGSGAGGRQL